ncbi:thioesterase domain-containing protein, partial [Caballeronia sp. dw_276]|uniref:thioesterase domain-containing protein n=1 Tax=Caballeronia sp. dw_276 TaxID=2719795 RepID=UPI00210527DF
QLLHAMGTRLARSCSLAELFMSPTVEDIASLIDSKPRSNSIVVPLQSGAADEAPLFLIHPVGGQVSVYLELARALGTRMPVFAVQAGASDAQYGSLDELADRYAKAIIDTWPGGPYRLAGWSSGGIFAMAVAARLEQRNAQLAYLGLIDTGLPRRALRPDDAMLAAQLTSIAALRGKRITEDERAAVSQLMQRAGTSDSWFAFPYDDPEVMTLLNDAFGTNFTNETFTAFQQQVAAAAGHLSLLGEFDMLPLSVSIHLVWSDGSINRSRYAEDFSRTLTVSDEVVVDGDHYAMLKGPHVVTLAQALLSAIANLQLTGS